MYWNMSQMCDSDLSQNLSENSNAVLELLLDT